VNLLERKETYSMTSDASWQTLRQDRVVIVDSVIARDLTLAKICQSTFALQFTQVQLYLVLFIVICCQFIVCYLSVEFAILPIVSYLHSFNSAWLLLILFHFVCFVSFHYSLFDYSVLFSVMILEMYSRYFDPHINNHPASQ
jgi:hypothetical protein